MGGIRAVRTAKRLTGSLVCAAAACLTLACGRASNGQEAERQDPELERKVEQLLPRIEKFTNLPVRRRPEVRRSSAQTLEAYLLERLKAEYPGDTLAAVAEAYRAFGLIPDTLDLRQLLVDLLLEQAVGYYDPGRDILYVRDDAAPLLVDAVLVHELVHALQDQEADLDRLLSSLPGNDQRTAAQSALEGHATLAMLSFQLNLGAAGLPELSPEMAGALVGASQFPRLAEAPAIIRDPLLFAYLGGARYVQRLWRNQEGSPPPLGIWLPKSTEQLLHTEKILEIPDIPLSLSIAQPQDGWRVRYARDLGELEIRIYFEEHLEHQALAARAAAGWDGDAYALVTRDGRQALVWYTAWDSQADAQEFADAYRAAFRARFGETEEAEELVAGGRRAQLERLSIDGTPVVLVVESDADVQVARPPELRIGAIGG
ncbi:MAG: hypothetical protein JSU87_03580 [Gemmatimonadota bacterium]|nr:MAG: hypothetical protein JSU87_03580 [Gemmatimonadota bacterium]